MKKISDREYKADEGKVIICKINKMKYEHIKLSSNDSIDNYTEIETPSYKPKKDIENAQHPKIEKKWGKQID